MLRAGLAGAETMKNTVVALIGLTVIGAGGLGGWVYAGKPNLLAMVQGQEEPATEIGQLSAETTALVSKYTATLEDDFVLQGAKETSAESVIALLPESVALTIESSSFDAASGATIWTGVSLSGADNTEIGLAADEVKLWGLNTDGIAARAAGTNFDETVKLADRIEAKGVKTLGLETMMTDFAITYVEGRRDRFGSCGGGSRRGNA